MPTEPATTETVPPATSTSATPPAAGTTPATTASTTPPAPTAADGTELGEGGKAALEAERKTARDALARATAAERKLEELRVSGLDEQGKAVEAAKTAGRTEALAEVNDRLIKAEAKAAAAGKLANPQLAAVLLSDQFDKFVAADGSIDTAAIAAAVDALLVTDPYLGTTSTTTTPAAGTTPPAAPAGTVPGGAQGGAAPTFKRSQLRDPAFYTANKDAILKAASEGRITND